MVLRPVAVSARALRAVVYASPEKIGAGVLALVAVGGFGALVGGALGFAALFLFRSSTTQHSDTGITIVCVVIGAVVGAVVLGAAWPK
jgi:hypothetical protein